MVDWKGWLPRGETTMRALAVAGAGVITLAWIAILLPSGACGSGEDSSRCFREWFTAIGSWAAAGATLATVLFLAKQVADGGRSLAFLEADKLVDEATKLRAITAFQAETNPKPTIRILTYGEGEFPMKRVDARTICREALDYEKNFASTLTSWQELIDESNASVGAYLDDNDNLAPKTSIGQIRDKAEAYKAEYYRTFMPGGLLDAIMESDDDVIDMKKIVALWLSIEMERLKLHAVIRARIDKTLLKASEIRRAALRI